MKFLCAGKTHIKTLFLYQLKQLSTTQLSVVPEGLRDYVKMLLNIKPELRPDAHQFTQVSCGEEVYFHNNFMLWLSDRVLPRCRCQNPELPRFVISMG